MNQTFFAVLFIFCLTGSSFISRQDSAEIVEICDNGIDDDFDGLVDLNDSDCTCEIISFESIITNPSFEDYDCCPTQNNMLHCANGWINPSGASPDYSNTCDNYYTPDMLPYPDGEAAVHLFNTDSLSGRFYREYIGTCLNSPLRANVTYRLTFYLGFLARLTSPNFDFVTFGSRYCYQLPFSSEHNCPTDNLAWNILESKWIDAAGVAPGWKKFSMTFQPTYDIHALVFGVDCTSPDYSIQRSYLLDDLQLINDANYDFELLDDLHPCDPNYTFSVIDNPNNNYQWYKDGVALLEENNTTLSQMYGEGSYQLRIIDKNTQECRVSDDYEFKIPVYQEELSLTLCEGESIIFEGDEITEEGNYEYQLVSDQGCDSTVMVNVVEQLAITDTIIQSTLKGIPITYDGVDYNNEGTYKIEDISSSGCDSSKVLIVEYEKIYIPNVFSPNNDGINDNFEVFTPNEEINLIELAIYDRWGNLQFKGDSWDGKVSGKTAEQGVYTSISTFSDGEGRTIQMISTVTLLNL